MSFAFNTGTGVDYINNLAFADGFGWALRLACAAGNAFICDCHCHDFVSSKIDLDAQNCIPPGWLLEPCLSVIKISHASVCVN